MATKWEYLVLTVTNDGKYKRDIRGERALEGSGSEQRPLNELGQEGWELVAVMAQGEGTGAAFFKRPIREERR